MSTTIPITRSTRQVTLEASAAQTVFTFNAGPVWDTADLVVQRKIWPANRFTTITTGFTLAQTGSPAGATGATCTFSVAPRPTLGDAAVQIRIVSRRVHERETDVSRAGRLHTPSLETEHDKITTTLQELRRDVDQNDTDLRAELEDVVLGQIPDGSLPDTKLEDMPAGTVKANLSGDADVPGNVSVAALLAALAAFVGDAGAGGTKGVVPAPAAGDAAANKFLAADGTWKVGGVADGDKGDITVSSSGTVWNIDAGAVGTAEIADAALTAAKFPAALDTVALPAIRKRLRNLPDLLDYGGYSDMTAAMDAAHTAAASEGFRRILIPSGSWTQATAPANIEHGLLYDGEDRSSTIVNVDHTGSAFRFTGALSGGGGVRNVFFQISGSTNALAAVRADGNNLGYAPDGLEIDNLWITYQSTGRWSYGLYFDGAPRGQAIVSGTISGTPTATFTASGASYGTNQFANGLRQVRMTSGTASGQFRTIVSNTSNTITMASAFSPNAASGDTFVVETVLYGIRNYRVSRITTFGTSTDALYIRNARAASFREILCNGVGGVSRISLIGNTSGVSERNDGVDFAGLIFGELLINNTNALNGFCTPQAGFSAGAGITNSGLAVPAAYQSAGPSTPPISGLTLY